jgi:hypothetical protein
MEFEDQLLAREVCFDFENCIRCFMICYSPFVEVMPVCLNKHASPLRQPETTVMKKKMVRNPVLLVEIGSRPIDLNRNSPTYLRWLHTNIALGFCAQTDRHLPWYSCHIAQSSSISQVV